MILFLQITPEYGQRAPWMKLTAAFTMIIREANLPACDANRCHVVESWDIHFGPSKGWKFHLFSPPFQTYTHRFPVSPAIHASFAYRAFDTWTMWRKSMVLTTLFIGADVPSWSQISTKLLRRNEQQTIVSQLFHPGYRWCPLFDTLMKVAEKSCSYTACKVRPQRSHVLVCFNSV